jgi:hypothetical protein
MEKRAIREIGLDLDRLIKVVIVACLSAEAVILLLDAFLNLAQFWYVETFKGLRDLSNAALENSFGTWFSIVQNFAVATVAFILALSHRLVFAQRAKSLGWLVIALVFAYISLDDHLVLHERMGGSMPVLLDWLCGQKMKALPTYGWIFLFGPFFGTVGVFFLLFLYRQLKSARYRIILVGALALWVLAVLMDAWDGSSNPYARLSNATGFREVGLRHVSMLVEEIFEMLGSTAFLYLFLSHIRFLYTRQPTAIVLRQQ